MRDIKFRAWNEAQEKMLNWYEFLNTNMENTFIAPESTGLILMQYTGLKDKNGKEIYEGDIVEGRVGDEEGFDVKGIVAYCQCGYYFITDKDDEVMIHIVDDLEVIGNIYDNPDLLEKVEEQV